VTSLILSGANYIKKDTGKGYQASKIAMGEEKKKNNNQQQQQKTSLSTKRPM
jgi:hypothetical protein